jgi:hypothetical protein
LSEVEVEPNVESRVPCRDGRSSDVGVPPLPAYGSELAARTLAGMAAEEGVGMVPAQGRVIERGMVSSDVGEFGVDDVESFGPPVVLEFPGHFRGEFCPALPNVGFAARDGIFRSSDVAFEPADPVEQCGFVVAASAAELGEATEFGEFAAGVLKPPDLFLPVVEGVGESPLGVAKVPETLGGRVARTA